MSSTTEKTTPISSLSSSDNTTSIIVGTTLSVVLISFIVCAILFLLRRRRIKTPLGKSINGDGDVGAFAKSFRKISPDVMHNDLKFHDNRIYSNLNPLNFNRSRHDYYLPGKHSGDYSSVKNYGKRSNSSGDILDVRKFTHSRDWRGNNKFRKYSNENIRVNPLYSSGIRRSGVYSSVRDSGYSRSSRDSSDDGYSTIPSVVLDERFSFQSGYAVIPHDSHCSIYTVVPNDYTLRPVPLSEINASCNPNQTSGYIVVNDSNIESFRQKVQRDERSRFHLAAPLLRPLNSEYITVKERALSDEYIRLKEDDYPVSDDEHILRLDASEHGTGRRMETNENSSLRRSRGSYGRFLNQRLNSDYVTINENGSIKYLTRVKSSGPRAPVPPVVLPQHRDYVTMSTLVNGIDYRALADETGQQTPGLFSGRDKPVRSGELNTDRHNLTGIDTTDTSNIDDGVEA